MRMYISPRAPKEVLDYAQAEANDSGRHANHAEGSCFPLSWNLPPGADLGEYEWVLNGFDTKDLPSINLVPVRRDEPWETIDAHLNRFGAEYLLGIMPTLWQLEVRFHAALRRSGIPVMMVPPINLASVPSLFAQFPIHTVLTPLRYLPELRTLLPSRDPHYMTILGPSDAPIECSPGGKVSQEVHLVPGMVALFQCETLAARPTTGFHPSDRFIWEWENDRLYVTDPAARFTRLMLPRHYTMREETCDCGRTLTLTEAV